MRRLALAIALACIVSGVIHAGEIHTTGAVAPPPPGTGTAAGGISSMTTTGEIPTTGATRSGEISTNGVVAVQDSTTAITIILTLFSIVP